MNQNSKVKLIARIKKANSDNWIQSFLKGSLTVVMYPFVLLVGVLTVVVALITSLFQRRSQNDISTNKVEEEPWSILTESNGVTIWKKYKGEIRFGPFYYDIKTEPAVLGFENEIFGDWFCFHGDGIFLQEWNNTNKPDTTLVYVDTKEMKVKVLKNSIKSVLWDIVKREDSRLELTCDTGDTILKYEVEV